ncbi:MAG: hypothetical protein ACOZIN_09460 [Myxococcota bacterium]
MSSPVRLAAFAALFALAACSGGKNATRPDGQSGDEAGNPQGQNINQTRTEEEKVIEFDLNHDEKPDVWSFTVEAKTDDGKEYDKLVRKELDINWDGKVDISRAYNDKEQIEREAMDLDFDGKIDQVNFYEKGVLIRKERDLDPKPGPDLWIFYEKGKIVRKERDSNGDGTIDYWEYWENDQVDRVGEDLDGDGQVDKWTKNPNSGA